MGIAFCFSQQNQKLRNSALGFDLFSTCAKTILPPPPIGRFYFRSPQHIRGRRSHIPNCTYNRALFIVALNTPAFLAIPLSANESFPSHFICSFQSKAPLIFSLSLGHHLALHLLTFHLRIRRSGHALGIHRGALADGIDAQLS